MNWISAEAVSKSYGIKWLFKDVSLGISEGDRIGLIGTNGSGKSTLLKVIAGIEPADSGTVARRRGLRVGYLGQQPTFDETASVWDNVFAADHETLRLIRTYETLMALPASNRPADYDEQLHQAMDAMNVAEAWSYEQQIHEILFRLGMGEFLEHPVNLLSGGQRKRVAMARLLIEAPELLVLDEPTNHLDLETIEWLEETIANRFKTILLVTHDRYFLDRVANRIVELDGGNLYPYKGNYAWFLEKKAEREAAQNTEQERARNLMRRELDWVRRQPKARGTKAKYRLDAFEELKDKATARRPQEQMALSVKLTRQGGKILDVKRLRKAYGEQLIIADFTHAFVRGEKVGIIGKNGVGKSTFLNVLMGNTPYDRGAIEQGENTVFGYYTQDDMPFREGQRVIEAVSEIADNIEMADGSKLTPMQLLQRFMFPPAMQQAQVETLSGGERKRLQLLRVLMRNPNFLVLDEPTNDLDIGTLNVLEEFLENFPGTVMIVSHDRYFMDRLVDHLFVFEGAGEIRDFPGNYTDWREAQQAKPAEPAAVPTAGIVVPVAEMPAATRDKRKRSFNEEREFTRLSEEIPVLEAERTALEAELATVGSDHARLLAITARLETLRNDLDEKELRWLELSEL